MKKHKTRIWSLVLAGIMSLSLLTGCSESQQIADAIIDGAKSQITSELDQAKDAITDAVGDAISDAAQPDTQTPDTPAPSAPVSTGTAALTGDTIPEYVGEQYTVINGNVPGFTEADITTEPIAYLSELDSLGRCGMTFYNISPETMPTEEREGIGMVKPSGWHTYKFDFVESRHLYNRCHLQAFQLTGLNADERNLITGTRSFNTSTDKTEVGEGMLPFENMVADYVRETGNHVLYRVTPIFKGDNLLAHGVQMEAWSVEDNGEGICFNVFVHNVEPGVVIDYATGEAWEDTSVSYEPAQKPQESSGAQASPSTTQTGNNQQSGSQADSEPVAEGTTYVLNTNSMKFHEPACSSVTDMSAKNRSDTTKTRDEVVAMGYAPCGACKP